MNWKVIAIMFAAVCIVWGGLTASITSDKECKVEHKAEVPQTLFPDGRYQAGEPEHYVVTASRYQVWKYTGQLSKGFRTAGVIVLGLVCIYIGICVRYGYLYKHGWFFGGAVLATALYFAAYSSAFEQNKKKLTPAEYKALNGDFCSLFSKDKLIR